MMKVYLDNGATTKTADEVVEAMNPYFNKKYGNSSSMHKWGMKAQKAMRKSRKNIAEKINATPDEIIFTSGGTESNNLTLKGLAFKNKGKKNHIIVSKAEHDCVLNSAKWLDKQGFDITYLNVDKYGIVDPTDLKKAITKDTFLVSIMHANNEIGTILPIGKYGKICRENNVLFHTDACQSFTKVPIDVKEMKLDLVTLNAHKIHGPKGVGALYKRKGIKITPLLHGGGHEFNLRSSTSNVSGIVGFAESAYIHTQEDIQKMETLRDYLKEELLKIPDTHLNGHPEERLCNNVSISFHFIEGESLLMNLSMRGIAVSTGSACSSNSLEPSHVLLAIGLAHEIAHGTIRFTLSRYTTKKEIDYTIKNVKEAVIKLREMSPLKKGVKYKTDDYDDEHQPIF
ncbi:aminotransferase class V-fold PLP-dependent enzyme [Candidatus Woesearchaeota archaeon]|nr:aminotransferase class V-fold PLP-dependent enzyme [Candidatus Woesearchaeota archaeon]